MQLGLCICSTGTDSQPKLKIQSELDSLQERVRLPRLHNSSSLKQVTVDADIAVASIPTNSLEDTMKLVYAIAVVVTKEMGYTVKKPHPDAGYQSVPPWMRRITAKVARLRADLSRLEQMQSGKLKNTLGLTSRYLTSGKHISIVIEELKQQVTALAGKLSKFKKRHLRYHQNTLISKGSTQN